MIDYHLILTRKFYQKDWSINGDTYEGLNWFNQTEPKPSKQELDALWPEVQEELAQEATNKQNIRQSALDKLAALGLTEEEIKSIL
jgi:hypothetical protein